MLLNRSGVGEYETPSKHQSREIKGWSDVAKGNIGRNFKENITITSVKGILKMKTSRRISKERHC